MKIEWCGFLFSLCLGYSCLLDLLKDMHCHLSLPFQSIKEEKLLNKYKEGLHQRRPYPKGRRNEEKEQQKVVNLEKKNLKYMPLQHLN